MANRIEIQTDGATVVVRPVGYLGGAWGAYKATTDANGCRSRKVDGQWRQEVPAAGVLALVEALSAKGFEVALSEPARTAARATIETGLADRGEAVDRLAAAETALADRGLALYPFQRVGIGWMAPRAAALLGDEQGLGKTVQALIAVPAGAPVLVVAPANVKAHWVVECRRWRPDLTPSYLSGRGAFRFPEPGELLVVNYDILPRAETDGRTPTVPASAGKPAAGTVLVCDEAHRVKDSKSIRGRAVRALVRAVRAEGGRAWAMTGTPLLNRPAEIWRVLDAFGLAQEAYGSWRRFLGMAGGYSNGYGTSWDSSRVDREACSAGLRRVMLRREVDDVMSELPAFTFSDIAVELDQATRRLADRALVALGVDPDATAAELARAIAAAMHSRSGAAFTELSRARAALASAKIPAMLERVEEHEGNAEPLIVFSAHRAPVDLLAQRDGWAAITGDVSPARRQEIVEAFQGGHLRGVALTIAAGCEGLTLTAARRVLFVDLDWTPGRNAQARARLRRISQKAAALFCEHLVADHAIDERVAALLAEKVSFSDDMVSGAKVDAEHDPFDTTALDRLDALRARTDEELSDDRARANGQATLWRAVADAVAASRRRVPGVSPIDAEPTRPAATAVERWAAAGLVTLAALDPDRAQEENGVGFNKGDSYAGASLASRLGVEGGLSDGEWRRAVEMLAKYHRQIGRRPDARVGAAETTELATA